MKRAWIVAGAAAAMLASGIAACGSGGSGTPAGNVSAPATSPAAAAAPGAPGGAAAPGHGSLTAPGSHLRFGEQATVGWVPPAADNLGAHQKGLSLRGAVESIQQGTIADFKNVQLNAAQRRSTPYYVTVRITALGDTPPPAHENPASSFDAIDDRGQQQESLIFLGTFARCNDNDAPKPFVSGESYQSCLAYLMPGGGSIQRVQWSSGPHAANRVTPYFDHPIVWGAG